ncbi:MAG: DUF373 family protein, partial [Candidatus Diapherotrites archaeon]|nr:DUF373 family protein [Candidatus Diapherotrites archaeon]
KQAKEVESIYYTIKEALRDPGIARTVFGIPGLILTVYAITLMIGAETQFFQGISLILGIYLLLKGFGIESRVLKGITHLTEGISVQRVSFPFYMASGFVFLFGVYTGLANYNPTSDSFTSIISAVQTTYFFAITSVLFMVLARAIDAVHAKKAYLLRKYVMYFIGITVLWLIIDSATLVFLRQTDLNFFLITVLISFIALLIAFKATQVIDIRGQVTQLLLNLPVYNNQGEWLGKIKQVRENENMIYYKPSGKKEFISIKKENFIVRKSRIIIQ